jgi:hypothetical protein
LTNTEVPLEEKTLEQQRKRARLEECIDDLDRERARLWRKLYGRAPRSKRIRLIPPLTRAELAQLRREERELLAKKEQEKKIPPSR